jgi:hypothetical protein
LVASGCSNGGRDGAQTIQEAQKQVLDLNGFDYSAPAELFAIHARRPKGRVTYKRFGTAAEAVRFAIEEMAPRSLGGAHLSIGEARFGAQEIQYLYANLAIRCTA